MLTLFPRPSRKPSPPKPPEPEPVASAPEPPTAELTVTGAVPAEVLADQPAPLGELVGEYLAEPVPEVSPETVAEEATKTDAGAGGKDFAVIIAGTHSVAPVAPPIDEIEAAPVEPLAVESAAVDAATAETAIAEQTKVEQTIVEAVTVESATVDPAAVESSTIDTAMVETVTIDPVAIESASEEIPVSVAQPIEFAAIEHPAEESTAADCVEEAPGVPAVEPSAEEPAATGAAGEMPSEAVAAETLPDAETAAESLSLEPLALEIAAEAPRDKTPVSDISATEAEHAPPNAQPSMDAPVAPETGSQQISEPGTENPPALERSPAGISQTHVEPGATASGILGLPRVAEPEVMDDAKEVEAYACAAAQAWLDQIDDSFVEHAMHLVKGRQRGRALDIGTGPGRIDLKLARRLSLWKVTGVDRSQKMIDEALSNLAATPSVAGRLEFHVADGNHLDFPNATFDLVICNSVLHHFAEPQNLLAELARVTKPRGAILLRDLRRPSRLAYTFHIRWHGRHYSGAMRKLYRDSVRAAYTVPELQRLLDASPLRDARVFKHGSTHIGLERPCRR